MSSDKSSISLSSSEDEVVDVSMSSVNMSRVTRFSRLKPSTSHLDQTSRTVDLSDSDYENESKTMDESSGSDSEDIIKPKTNRKARIVSDDDSDEDTDEDRPFSPHTRYSMTGIRPKDLVSSDEEKDHDEISESHNVSQTSDMETSFAAETSFAKSISTKPPNQNVHTSQNLDTTQEDQAEDQHESKNTNNISQISDMETSFAEQQHSAKNESIASDQSTVLHSFDAEGFKENSKLQITDGNISRRSLPAGSPLVPLTGTPRESFYRSISDKLSSTIHDNIQSDTIEILSSDEENIAPEKQLLQPKISTLMKKSIVKSNTSDIVELVSRSFYQREETKLSDLLSQMKTTKHLYDTKKDSLHDKGISLLRKQENLEEVIELQKQNLKKMQVDDNSIDDGAKAKIQRSFEIIEMKLPSPTTSSKVEPKMASKPISWEELKKITDQVQPKYTGVKGIQTFETQKTIMMDRLQNLHGSMETCPPETELHANPKYLKINLMTHQQYGLSWMLWREQQKPRGGILADDMGLGKTLSMIGLILAANELTGNEKGKDEESDLSGEEDSTKWQSKGRKSHYDGGTLVVCPASLTGQWEKEINDHVKRNHLSVLIHHGPKRDNKARHIAKYDVVITTYNIISIDQNAEVGTAGVRWNRIILDEAHCIRNHKSKTSIAVSALKGRYRWALTGTPIQNKELDLYALLKFLRCSPFDDFAYWKKWIDNKSAGGQARLSALLKTLMLRRTKQHLIENEGISIPAKTIELVQVKLDMEESNVYQKVLMYSQNLFTEYLYQKQKKDFDYIVKDKEYEKKLTVMHKQFKKVHGNEEIRAHVILVLLLRLRQICCHPGLIDAMLENTDTSGMDISVVKPELDLLEHLNKMKITDAESVEDAKTDAEEELNKASSKVMLRSNPVFDFERPSSKLRRVLELLEERVLHTNDKAVIVSQWPTYLNILAKFLDQKRVSYCILSGSVLVHKRNEIVVDFNRVSGGAKVMLLSLTAGGVGLNLIGGNHLFLLDLHWNPQLEAQAQDRIYRVGQKKPVFIYKLMCSDTVEQRIKALQDKKLEIATNVLTGTRNTASKLSIDDLKSLFDL